MAAGKVMQVRKGWCFFFRILCSAKSTFAIAPCLVCSNFCRNLHSFKKCNIHHNYYSIGVECNSSWQCKHLPFSSHCSFKSITCVCSILPITSPCPSIRGKLHQLVSFTLILYGSQLLKAISWYDKTSYNMLGSWTLTLATVVCWGPTLTAQLNV